MPDRLSTAGYQVLSIPEADLAPWTVIAGNNNNFMSWGPIWNFTEDAVKGPVYQNRDAPTDLQNGYNRDVDASAGFSILQALGIVQKAKVSAEYKNARNLSFDYKNLKRDCIQLMDISKYIKIHPPKSDILTYENVPESLNDGGDAALIIETLKTTAIAVVAKDQNGLQVTAEGATPVAGANAGLNVSTGKDDNLSYAGNTPLIFAYKAVPFWICEENGRCQFHYKAKTVERTQKLFLKAMGTGRGASHGSPMASVGVDSGQPAGSAIKEKSVTISPGYLEQLGTLDKDFNLKYKPDYKIYSNEIMIERRYPDMDLRKTQK